MRDLTDDQWRSLTRDLAERVAADAPGWTDTTDSDPGVTVVQLMAFLGESLLERSGGSERVLARLRGLAAQADARSAVDAAGQLPCSELATATRVRYFIGQLLGVADFEQEQSYGRQKARRHNLLLHGVGIVRGLDVTVEPPDDAGGQQVEVSPGVAIGPDGEELIVCEPVSTPLPSSGSILVVGLRLVERPVAIVPGSDREADGGEASRLEEAAAIEVVAEPAPLSLAIARLTREDGAWGVDPAFPPLQSG